MDSAQDLHIAGPAGRLAVRVVGTGPSIVLVPSLGRSVSDFEDLATRLASCDWRVVLPEPRGLGGSVNVPGARTLADLADDVDAVIQTAVPERRAVVVGHAFGNRVARMVAAQHPSVTPGLVLLACGGAVPPSRPHAEAVRRCFDLTLPHDEHLAAVATAFFAPGNDPQPWSEGWYPSVAAVQAAADRATHVTSWWYAGDASVLVVQAEHDVIAAPQNADRSASDLGERATIRHLAPA